MEDNINDSVELIQLSGNDLSGDLAQFDMQVTTAKKFPRNLMKIQQTINVIITNDARFAEKCVYRLKRGGKDIIGPSAALSKVFMQQYGNIRAESRVVGFEGANVVAEAVVWDLETNLAYKCRMLRRITDKNNQKFSDDMQVVTGNAAASIALRNALWAIVPANFIDNALELAKSTVLGSISEESAFLAKRDEMMRKCTNLLGLSEKEVLDHIGVETVLLISRDDLYLLHGTLQLIEQGDSSVEQIFRPKVEKPITKMGEKQTSAPEMSQEDFLKKVEEKFQVRNKSTTAMAMSWLNNITKTPMKSAYAEYSTAQAEYMKSKAIKDLAGFLNKAELEKIVEFCKILYPVTDGGVSKEDSKQVD